MKTTNKIFFKKLKRLYCAGMTFEDIGTKLRLSQQRAHHYLSYVEMKQKDLDGMEWRLQEINKEADGLRSDKSPKATRLEDRWQRIFRRIKKYSKFTNA